MTSKELRQKYLDFFKSKGHSIFPSASLIPDNDPTVLFTTAGMHPLVPYLMGESHPLGKRLANSQKCIRTVDIEEVGDSTHHTFFEMLGNWSLGDYFKKEAISWSWEFLTTPEWMGLDKNLIAVSVFAGDDDALFDQEAFEYWRDVIGLPEKRIAKLPKKNNWWGPAGVTGPCGPDTEMFYWTGDPNEAPESFNDDNDLWVEIWNDVFMQYNKNSAGKYELLASQNVDTGMGLERITAVKNGIYDNYKTDLFTSIIDKIESLSGKNYDDSDEIKKSMRIIADHIKAATFIMGDDKNISPSNIGQGYVVRRLIRRAIRYGKQLEISREFWTREVAKIVIHDYLSIYPELQRNIEFILGQFNEEEEKFKKTLEQGLKEYEKIDHYIRQQKKEIDYFKVGQLLFDLYQSYGFPIELSLEELYRRNALNKINSDKIKLGYVDGFNQHQELSRTASAGMFKGGLADASKETIKYHTAAHLMLAGLRKVLGDHVTQKGSNITAERLRFDFAHGEKMTPEQIKQVEDFVNEAIEQKLDVNCDEMTLDEAKVQNAMGVFESKYGEKVKVYTIGLSTPSTDSTSSLQVGSGSAISREICGGPHVKNTGELGHFKIKKEESSSAGVRRIKAILE
jgi:alanyl-tRNA synthetase